jgi:hypothetical protein
VRGLAQYGVEEVDVLRAPDGRPYLREGEPFRVRRGNRPAWDAPQLNPLRLDLLLSWRPSPGTVAFLGYGREVTDEEAFRFERICAAYGWPVPQAQPPLPELTAGGYDPRTGRLLSRSRPDRS